MGAVTHPSVTPLLHKFMGGGMTSFAQPAYSQGFVIVRVMSKCGVGY